MALTTIDDRGLKTPIDLLDDEKIRLGTGNDLEVYHNGSNSLIKNGTGNLLVRSDTITFESAAGDETYIDCNDDGSVELYHNNVKRIETTTAGFNLWEDTDKVISFSGGIGEIGSVPGLQAANGDLSAIASFGIRGADIRLATGNAERVRITSGGDVAIQNDSGKFTCGTGNDLQIYHDGTDDIIHSTGTSLRTRSNIFRANNASNDAVLFRASASGNFEAYYDGSKQLETYSTGVQITNDLKLYDSKILRLGTATNGDLKLYHNGTDSFIDNVTGNLNLRVNNTEVCLVAAPNGATFLYYDAVKKLETTSTGIGVTGTIASVSTNDLKLSTADSGADMQFQLNGTTVMTLQNTSKLEVNDNFETVWGNGSDLRIYHNGTYNFVKSSNASGIVFNQAVFSVNNQADSEMMIKATENGSVDLYHDDSKKFETTSYGITAYTGSGTGAATGYGLQVFGGTSARTAPAIYLSGGAGNSDNSSIFSKYNLTLGCNQPTNIADRFVEFVNGSNRMGGFGTAGLTFGTDTADANALDDYEEGTWTPAYTPASGSFTMFNASGTYVKIGKLVMCSGTLSCNGSSSPSGAVHISGLPFTVDAVGGSWNNQGGGGSVFPGYNFTNDMTNLVCVKSGTTAYVFDDSATGLATSDVGTGYNEGQSSFTFTYTHA